MKLALPRKERKVPLMVEIEEELLEKVKEQIKMDGLTLRSVVEFGLRIYLEATTGAK